MCVSSLSHTSLVGQPEKWPLTHRIPASVCGEPRFSSLGEKIHKRIYSFCEDSDLLILGKTCKSLNTTALGHLFSRNHSANWLFEKSQSLVKLWDLGPHVSPALCVALFVKPSKVFTYTFQPDVDMIFSDLHHLTHFLGRPAPAGNSTVKLSFSGIDGRLIRGSPAPFLDFDRFLEGLKRLLDAAVKRGTAEVSVIGGKWFLYMHRGKAPQWLWAILTNGRTQDGSGESPLPDSIASQCAFQSAFA